MAGRLHPTAVRLTEAEARRARPLLDRLAVRRPALMFAATRLALALPPRLGDPLLRFGHEFTGGRLAAQTYWWDQAAGRRALGLQGRDTRR